MEFKMERPGLVEPGQIVDVTEGVVAAYFYYTIEPAVAMSANYRSWQRLKSGQGKVIDVKQTPQGYYVVCEFDEEDVELREGKIHWKEFNIKRSENDKKCGYQTLIFLYCHVYGRKLPVADSADAE